MSERLRKAVLDHNYPRLLAWAVVVVFLAMIAAAIVQACVPYPPIPAAPPTIAPSATPFVSTHVPTRTLTPIPDTATWTPTPSYSPTITATNTATLSPTATVEPSLSVEPSASPTPTATLPLMPHTGASAEELTRIAETATATPTGTPAPSATVSSEIEPPALPVCAVKWKVVYYHWEAGEWTMKLRCPMVTPKPEAGV